MPHKDPVKRKIYFKLRERNPKRYAYKVKYNREWRRIHRPASWMKSLYGITLEDKKNMYANQQGLCGVCGEALPKEWRKAHVDHNHKTNKVRQLVHRHCNLAVGHEENFPGLLLKVLAYIEHWNKQEGVI